MTHKPTDETRKKVGDLTVAGYGKEKVAAYLRISDDTLKKYYAHELEAPLMDCTALLSNDLFMSAVNGDKDDRRFWLTHRGGWYKTPTPEKKEDAEAKESIIEKLIDKIPKQG